MNYEQTTIFDFLGKNTKQEIINSLKNYGIDNLYKIKFKPGSYTFLEVYHMLSENKNFKEYLNALSCELKKHIKESNNSHQDFYNNLQINTFTKREDCIMIYNFRKKCIGPIYCAEMLSESLFEE